MIDITNPIFSDEDKAREYLETQRWPDGPFCPHCGETENLRRLMGKSHRPGLIQCNGCRKNFTVTVGTLYERSRVPLHKWLLATHLLCASKKGISTYQLHRMLGVTYKTAWFTTHRIREARDDNLRPAGEGGGTVEVDETFIGHDKTRKPRGQKKGRGYHHKYKVLTLVERDGKARSFHVDNVNAKTLAPIPRENIDREARIMTDEVAYYMKVGREFAEHGVVRHNVGEYGRGEIHTNTIEGYFSIFERGMKGVYQHCGKQHLHRYLAKFDFRYSNRAALGIEDEDRANRVLRGIVGRRLSYQTTNSQVSAHG